MKYIEYKQKRQKDFEKLPIFFAFSDKQFKEAMNERGLSVENDLDKIYRLGNCGGFYLKKDAQIIRDFLNKTDVLFELMQEPDFAIDAFYYEMGNFEYSINWDGDFEVCNCFGNCTYSEEKTAKDYLEEIGYDDSVYNSFKIASKKHFKDMENYGY